MKTTTEIAQSFVDLALKYDWGLVTELPPSDVQILFETVSAAGFKVMKVVPGKLRGDYLEQGGERTGKTYPINSFCPYKVVSQTGEDYFHATGWLDCALRLVIRTGMDRPQLIKRVQQEIKRSIPLDPIKLTTEGDMLREYPSSSNDYFVDHTRDDCILSSCVGIHDRCNGWVERLKATATYDALSCRHCHMRILFPKEVKTYRDLRKALASKLDKVAV